MTEGEGGHFKMLFHENTLHVAKKLVHQGAEPVFYLQGVLFPPAEEFMSSHLQAGAVQFFVPCQSAACRFPKYSS